MFDFYKVGGCVRDKILGLESKDIDYSCVFKDWHGENIQEVFKILSDYLKREGYTIWLETPDCYTIRAKAHNGQTHDYVLARKEIGYIPGTRKPSLVPGTLFDDLERRDFRANAIAEDQDGNYIDYFNGIDDIKNRVLRCPISPETSFNDDPLRILRAIRFAITKDFKLSYDIIKAIKNFNYNSKFSIVSEERIREELYKCLKFNTLLTLEYLHKYDNLSKYIFIKTKLWLKPTNEL